MYMYMTRPKVSTINDLGRRAEEKSKMIYFPRECLSEVFFPEKGLEFFFPAKDLKIKIKPPFHLLLRYLKK